MSDDETPWCVVEFIDGMLGPDYFECVDELIKASDLKLATEKDLVIPFLEEKK